MTSLHAPSLPLMVLCASLIAAAPGPSRAGAPDTSGTRERPTTAHAPWAVPAAFWSTWGDGRAEVSTYKGSRVRYGEARDTTVVAVFVTEDFSAKKRVKADAGKNEISDVFPVIKLNLMEDFTTGIYDYHLMTSTFLSLSSSANVVAGSPAKVSFSAQEWCGTTYHHLLFDGGRARETIHSYFDGEADRLGTVDIPAHTVAEDTVWLWARGLAAPAMSPGESRVVPFLPALRRARLEHFAVRPTVATLVVHAAPVELSVPAGTFSTERREILVEGGHTLNFYVERGGSQRVVRVVERDGGAETHVDLVASERTPYWKENASSFVKRRDALGL